MIPRFGTVITSAFSHQSEPRGGRREGGRVTPQPPVTLGGQNPIGSPTGSLAPRQEPRHALGGSRVARRTHDFAFPAFATMVLGSTGRRCRGISMRFLPAR